MKHCKLCDVDVKTNKNYCPLCFNALEGGNESVETLYLPNTKKETHLKKHYLVNQILLFLTIIANCICVFINIVTSKNVLWSLIVLASSLYLWVLIRHTIMSNRSAFEKAFFQIVGLILILVSSHIVSGGGDWLINYVIPSITIFATIVLSMIIMCNKKRKNFLTGFLILFALMLLMSVIFIVFKFDTFKILNEINILVTALAILGIIIFGHKTLKNEFSKKLHI